MAELEVELNQPSESETRINQLSKKVSLTVEERDAAKAEAETAQVGKAEAERERDFYAGFSDVVATNPQAKDHKDDILAKVKSGYTVEDATYAVLGKAGKLGVPTETAQVQVVGGSATTNPTAGSETKTIAEMSLAEKRAALVEMETRGDISFN